MSLRSAIEKYIDFHQYEPRNIGEFPKSFFIPPEIVCVGTAQHVMYRSGKKDPETLIKPKKPLNYIHEHKAGVKLYRADKNAEGAYKKVPGWIQETQALALLGECLGFCYEDYEGNEVEAEMRTPRPELYAVPPHGKALIVIQNKRKVLAMMWGGQLVVEARGIVG